MKTGLSQGVRLLVQFCSVIVLSRLLMPSEFGLMAMAAPIVSLASLFQDLGLTQAVVQKPRLTHAEMSGLFGISVCMSLTIALLLMAISPLVAGFYKEPRVGLLTAAMGLNIIISGAGSLHYALLNRHMRFGTLAVIDAASAVGGLAASIVVAFIYRSFWALYAGGVISSVIPTVGYWIVIRWRPSLPRRGSGIARALHFGANVTGFNLANFVSRNLDNVLIGRVWGEYAIGLYDRAYKLLLLPLQQINAPFAKVMLPVLSQMAGDPTRYRQAFLRTQAQMLLVTMPVIAFMVGTADVFVPVLLGHQWAGASSIFAVLGLVGFLQPLNNPTGWLFISQDRTRDYMYWGLFGSLTSAISFLIGISYGPLGVAISYTLVEYARTPILWWYVTRRGPITIPLVARTAMPFFAGALASLAAIAGLRSLVPMDNFVLLAACLIVSLLVSAMVICTFAKGREAVRQTLNLLTRLMTRWAFVS